MTMPTDRQLRRAARATRRQSRLARLSALLPAATGDRRDRLVAEITRLRLIEERQASYGRRAA